MVLLFLIAYVLLFISTVTESATIVLLLPISVALGGYCLFIMCSKTEKLTDIGKRVFVLAVIGFVYSIMTISGFDIRSLF